MTRRHALLLTGGTLTAQRLTPVEDLANTLEMEAAARHMVSPALFSEIAGSDRSAFDRITLRPRLMVNTLGLDLSLDLFGERLFAPILIGPTALQGRFHADAERAMIEGADAAKTAVVFSANTTIPAEQLAPVWMEMDPAKQAIPPSAKVLILTVPFGWADFDRLRNATKLPLIVKGVMSPGDAQLLAKRGANGIIVSNYRKTPTTGLAAPIEVLPSIAAEINNKIPILIDGSFRRGSDILKALALGARAVLLGRPPLWGLAAYGARGVRQVMEQLQTELARDMAMCGKITLQQLAPDLVKIHRR
jgi:isopentenyl diphosphate isomerase/L-lactate dehydrogenase-like FMN-dependent dehydrogenase